MLISYVKYIAFTVLGLALFSSAEDLAHLTNGDRYAYTTNSGIGESHDQRRGDLSVEIPLVTLPGHNGLSLDVGISFNKVSTVMGTSSMFGYTVGTATYFDEMAFLGGGAGGWNIEIPRIVGGRRSDIFCDQPSLGSTGTTLVIPGKAPIRLLRKQTGNFGAMELVSNDGWTAKCIPHHYATHAMGSGGKGNFLVRSPNGLIYKFEMLPPILHEGKAVTPNRPTLQGIGLGSYLATVEPVIFYANRIEDLHGNWINFAFNGFLPSRITSSDGRDVELRWRKFSSTTTGTVGKPRTFAFDLLDAVVTNGKTWRMEYAACSPAITGEGCMSDFVPNSIGTKPIIYVQNILKGIIHPDGLKHTFNYKSYSDVSGIAGLSINTDTIARPGVSYHLKSITTPAGLTSTYEFMKLCSYYVDGFRPSTYLQPPMIDRFNACGSSYLALTSRADTGVGLPAGLNYSYLYHVPNFDPNWPAQIKTYLRAGNVPHNGDKVSYFFELGPTKMKVVKFRRDPGAGDLGRDYNSSLFDAYLPLETAILPLPPAGVEALPTMPTPPPPPPPPPSVEINNFQFQYAIGAPVYFSFSAGSTSTILAANCSVDYGPLLPCTTTTSHTIAAGLSQGTHVITIQIRDLTGQVATREIEFWVGPKVPPNAPLLAMDLKDAVASFGQPVTLQAIFQGTVTTYTWLKNGVAIPGETKNTLTIASLKSSDLGTYQLIARNSYGSNATSVRTLKADTAALTAIINSVLED